MGGGGGGREGGGKSEREAVAKYKTVTVGMILNYDVRSGVQWHLAQMHANLHSASLVEFTSPVFTRILRESSSL